MTPIQRPVLTSHCEMGEASMRAKTSPAPPAKPQTTKTPTASSAKSLTIASTAMAMTTPLCRSFTSRLRVPNKIVNTARPAAVHKAILVELSMF